MTKDQIITQINNNDKIIKYCKAISGAEWEELKSELLIQLYKMDYQKLLLAYQGNYIEYTCFTICKRISYGNISGTGIFYKKQIYDCIDDNVHIMEEEDWKGNQDNDRLNRINELIENKHWYGKTLFKLYYTEGYNLREISDRYGINIKSIHYIINKMKKEIQKEIKK